MGQKMARQYAGTHCVVEYMNSGSVSLEDIIALARRVGCTVEQTPVLPRSAVITPPECVGLEWAQASDPQQDLAEACDDEIGLGLNPQGPVVSYPAKVMFSIWLYTGYIEESLQLFKPLLAEHGGVLFHAEDRLFDLTTLPEFCDSVRRNY